MTQIRQPIVTIVGHVDHGKTTLLDSFRDSSVAAEEAGGITQKISFTQFPLSQIKKACPLINKHGIKLEIPGFLFIDTPGHAAFTNLRKRGGSLADLAVLVVSIKDGIKPQTAEVLQILKAHKTPFLIALNKIDALSGWKTQNEKNLEESIESQALNVSQEFQEALLIFQGSLSEFGFDSDLYFNIEDFTKKIAIVPCSAKTKEGIPEILLTLCGLSQKFLKDSLSLSEEARGVILEIKKEKSIDAIEAILYDGILKIKDEIAIASFDEVIQTRIRAIEDIEPLSFKYKPSEKVKAATGIRLHLTNREGVLSGMPFQKVQNNFENIKESFKKEISQLIQPDKEGIVIKADSLGSLEALMLLLRQEQIQIVKAEIGQIGKSDIVSAKANLEIAPLNAVVVGFNVGLQEDIESGNVKILTENVIYKLIEELKKWREERNQQIEKERMLGLAPLCKIQILSNYLFRNSNPAVFGIYVTGGKLKTGIELIDEKGERVARIKEMQMEKKSITEASEGQELAIALPAINFDRRLKEIKFLYSEISEKSFKNFLKNKDLLSSNETKILHEIAEIKRKTNDLWGK